MTTDVGSDRMLTLGRADIDALPWTEVGLHGVQMKELYRRGDAVTGLLHLDAGAHEPPHRHRHADHELWVLRGTARIAGTDVREGCYVHVPAGVEHATTSVGPQGCTLLYVYRPVG